MKTHWIGIIKWNDGTILRTEPFYKYDEGIKVWASKFSFENKGKFEWINYERVKEPKKETLEEAGKIDLTKLCYYDKRNPDCTADDEAIEDHKAQLLRVSKKLGYNKTCSCDNCFYGRSKLTEQLIWQAERMYSEEEVLKLLIKCHFVEQNIEEWFEQHKKK
jgi:hypothetical protein